MPHESARRRRGRPRQPGDLTCARCGERVKKIEVIWPDGRICYPCFCLAVRTTGRCDRCGQQRLLPGRDGDRRLCRNCAGITTPLDCTRCGLEGPRYRVGICVRCALRDDLNELLIPVPTAPREGTRQIVDAFCAAGRPESLMTWKRNPRVRQALSAIGNGTLPMRHADIDQADLGREGEHLRAIMVHLNLMPARDSDLVRLERWLHQRLAAIDDPAIRRPLELFATWHHLQRIRRKASSNEPVAGPAVGVRLKSPPFRISFPGSAETTAEPSTIARRPTSTNGSPKAQQGGGRSAPSLCGPPATTSALG